MQRCQNRRLIGSDTTFLHLPLKSLPLLKLIILTT